MARVESRLDSIDATLYRINDRLDRMDARFDQVDRRIDARFDRVDGRIDGLRGEMLTKWDVFQVIVYVLGAATAALLLGPRLYALLPPV